MVTVHWSPDRRQAAVLASTLIFAFGVASCGDSTAPNQPECAGPVDIHVTGGTTPTITWIPACRLFVLGVEAEDGDVWLIVSEGGNRIPSGVRYGIVPRSAVADRPAVPLVAGETYNIFAGRHTGPGSDDGVLVGTLEFTP